MSRIDLWNDAWVAGTAGPGFRAYARIFHPLNGAPETRRWADVAAENGQVMDASAQWHQVRSRAWSAGPSTDSQADPRSPEDGNLRLAELRALCSLLAKHTNHPDECWFAVWDGWGWQHEGSHRVVVTGPNGELVPARAAPAELKLDLTGPTFALPGRTYRLFEGPIADATKIGHWPTADRFVPQSPSMFWPTDHAWCVATEIDLDSTLVGGSRELIADITNCEALEALPIAEDARHGTVDTDC